MGTMDMLSGSLTYVAQQLGRARLPLLLFIAAVVLIVTFAIAFLAAGALVATSEPILAAPLRW
jgi:hypothetical protein